MKSIEQELRKAARKCRHSMRELSRRTGIPYASVHGFIRGNRMIQIDTASALALELGFELRPVKSRWWPWRRK